MPVNRSGQPAAEKRAQLASAARSMFLTQGYEATSMNQIAKEAHVTPNTIYWYFKDKDELLIAVLSDLMQEDLMAYAKEAEHTSPVDQLVWLVGRLRKVSTLISTVHSRMRESDSINAWHDHFHAVFEHLLTSKVTTPWSAEQQAAEIRVLTFTLEGLVSHEVNPAATRLTCEALVSRWINAAAFK